MVNANDQTTMNRIDKNELFQHLSGFLKAKGVELKEGSYTQRIQKGCGLLAETVNLSQQAIERTKAEMDKRLDRMRQVIHEKTAPKTTAGRPPSDPVPAAGTTGTANAPKKKASAVKPKRRNGQTGRRK